MYYEARYDKYRDLLQSQARDELNILARQLKIPRYRKLGKDSLIEAILQNDPKKISSLLIPSWWTKFHNHVYGVVGILSALLSILFFYWQTKQPNMPTLAAIQTATSMPSPIPTPSPSSSPKPSLVSSPTRPPSTSARKPIRKQSEATKLQRRKEEALRILRSQK